MAKAQAKADDLLAQLRGGADFASIAQGKLRMIRLGEGGGDLGWVERGLMVTAFEDAALLCRKRRTR